MVQLLPIDYHTCSVATLWSSNRTQNIMNISTNNYVLMNTIFHSRAIWVIYLNKFSGLRIMTKRYVWFHSVCNNYSLLISTLPSVPDLFLHSCQSVGRVVRGTCQSRAWCMACFEAYRNAISKSNQNYITYSKSSRLRFWSWEFCRMFEGLSNSLW